MALFRLVLAMGLFVVGLAYPRMNYGGQKGAYRQFGGQMGAYRQFGGQMGAYRQFGGQIGGQFAQNTRLMQAACLVTDVNTGNKLRNTSCVCGDETVACDVGPVTFGNVELTFCNTLDDQTEDDLYVMQFACDEDESQCGAGTFCDVGPLAVGEDEYYLCRFNYNQVNDDDDNEMCKPDFSVNSGFPMLGIGQRMGRGSRGRWATAGVNPPIQGQSGVQNWGQMGSPMMGSGQGRRSGYRGQSSRGGRRGQQGGRRGRF